MKVMITGGAGYVGLALYKRLKEEGHEVTVYDNFLYGEKIEKKNFISGDVRHADHLYKQMEDSDAVVHLAALSNDPLADLDPSLAITTNVIGSQIVRDCAERLKIPKLVFASSCSVYGFQEGNLKETSKLAPVSLYAKTKLEGEKIFLSMEQCAPTILRFATIYGYAPKMRFDLVVNTMTAHATTKNEIVIQGGEQWRPCVHVEDVANAIKLSLEAPKKRVSHQIFNVGSNEQNYQIKEIGKIVAATIPNTKVTLKETPDNRSYKVDFNKIATQLDFKTQKTVKDGVKEINEALKAKIIPDHNRDVYYRVKYLTNYYGKLQY